MNRRLLWIGLLGLAGVLIWTWWRSGSRPDAASGPDPAPTVTKPARIEEVYERVHRKFDRAFYLKPANLQEGELASALAPLLMVELPPKTTQPVPPQFGALELDGTGRIRMVDAPPTIYFGTNLAVLQGRPTPQYYYLWWYRALDQPTGAWRHQGVRITIDLKNRPVLWEVLHDSAGVRPIYVSLSLEEVARGEFGRPLPGRRLTVERSRAEFSEVAAVRALDDGPVPMGPIIYLQPETLDVSTLLCRCMESQVTGSVVAAEYTLTALEVALAGTAAAVLPAPAPPALRLGRLPSGSTPDAAARPDWLERCLRLPAVWP